MYGVWEKEPMGAFMFINEDGTFAVAGSNTPDNPWFFGQYRLEGSTLTFHYDDESPNCSGYSSSARVRFIEEEKFQLSSLDERCPNPYTDDIETWVRNSP